LKSHFRVIVLDFPGFGLSIANKNYDYLPQSHSCILEDFVNKIAVKDISLFVHDWGGPIGLGFAGRRPELITRIIIGNTWAWPVNDDFHFVAFSKIMGGPIGKFFILHFNAFVNLLLPKGTPKSKISKNVLRIYQMAMPPERRFATYIFPREITRSKIFLMQVEENLKKIKTKPTLFLWGNKDFAFRSVELNKFQQLFTNNETKILEGAGHYIQEDAPTEICEAILAWSLKNN
jgi:haloalkane dehalogenase